MKKTKIIIPAMGMLLLGTAASVTGTVAWFSANNKVSVTGMAVTTKVSNNLLISEDNVEANYASSMDEQTRTGILEPVSTIDGVGFYWTANNNVTGDGSAKTNSFTQYSEDTALDNVTNANKTHYDNEFNANYGLSTGVTTSNVCYGYIDYNFYLKASTSSANQNLSMTECNLLYNHNALSANDKSWRVAVFAQKVNESVSGAVPSDTTNLISILRPSGALYFSDKAVSGATTTAAPNGKIDDAATLDTIAAAGTVQRYYVTVRLYLEGNDTKCTNDTYAILTEAYTLDLAFELGADAGLANIESYAARATVSNNSATVSMRNGVSLTSATYQWEKYDAGEWGNASGASATTATYNGTEGERVRCKVTVSEVTYLSNEVTLEAAAA